LTFTLAGIEVFSQIKGVPQDTEQEVKPLKSSNCLWSGKIQISKEKRFPQWRTWETSGCIHGRSADRGGRLFPVIL